ncbi:hypothetical protein [Listeria rocourtiae]|uniref:hypothetical protein n=1 Tax=Listeria rocourtiae TaxID=647910 RepID=UPI003D2F9B86
MLYSFKEIERQLQKYEESIEKEEHVSAIKTASSSSLNKKNDKYNNVFKQGSSINGSLMNL